MIAGANRRGEGGRTGAAAVGGGAVDERSRRHGPVRPVSLSLALAGWKRRRRGGELCGAVRRGGSWGFQPGLGCPAAGKARAVWSG